MQTSRALPLSRGLGEICNNNARDHPVTKSNFARAGSLQQHMLQHAHQRRTRRIPTGGALEQTKGVLEAPKDQTAHARATARQARAMQAPGQHAHALDIMLTKQLT